MPAPSVLLCHNRYRQRGGEDVVFENELNLLKSNGHEVDTYEVENRDVPSWKWPTHGFSVTWNQTSYRNLLRLIDSFHPDVVHCHNTFPVISPSIYYAARRRGIPVVQTLHNYRLLCPSATLFRDGKTCELCVNKTVPWPGVVHGCYQHGKLASAAVATMLLTHNVLGTWRKEVTLFLALTEFARQKFTEGGLPPDRIIVKPNFVANDPGVGSGDGDFVLYAGRLSPEKGILLLLEAWTKVRGGKLLIAGDGPLAGIVKQAAQRAGNIEYAGFLKPADLSALVGRARALVFPSISYEGLPGAIIEAFSCGTPVLAGSLGSMQHLIRDGQTGWLVKPRDADALAHALSAIFSTPQQALGMRAAARAAYEENYTPATNYRRLMDVYARAISIHSER